MLITLCLPFSLMLLLIGDNFKYYNNTLHVHENDLFLFSDKSIRVLSTFVDGLKIVGTEGKTTRWARLANDPTGYFAENFSITQNLKYSNVKTNQLSWVQFFLNFSIKSWSNFKIRDSFEFYMFSAFQNFPWFWNLTKI